jgi:hypothetical protein
MTAAFYFWQSQKVKSEAILVASRGAPTELSYVNVSK